MMKRPTERELEITRDTVLWLKHSTEKHEPFATNFIAACETVYDEMPTDEFELFDD